MRPTPSICSMLLLLTGVCAAIGCSTDRDTQPSMDDPRAALRAMQAALRQTESLSYAFTFRQEPSGSEAVGRAWLRRTNETGSGYLVRVEATVTPSDGPGHEVATVRQADGSVYAWRSDRGVVEHSSLYAWGSSLLAGVQDFLLYPLYDPASLDGEIDAAEVDWIDAATAEEGACKRIIRVAYEDDPEVSQWCVGVDSLPRRMAWLEGDTKTLLALDALETSALPADRFDYPLSDDVPVIEIHRGLPVGETVPDWVLESSTGNAVSSRDLRGSTIVLDFWATWCPPCVASLESLARRAEALPANRPVRFFAVNTRETVDRQAALRFLSTRDLDLTVLWDGDDLHRSFAVGNLPATAVIDANGILHGMTTGYFGAPSEAYLDQLIGGATGNPVTTP